MTIEYYKSPFHAMEREALADIVCDQVDEKIREQSMNEETKVSGNLRHRPSSSAYFPDGYYYVMSGEDTIPILQEAIRLLSPNDLIAMAKHLKKLRGGK